MEDYLGMELELQDWSIIIDNSDEKFKINKEEEIKGIPIDLWDIDNRYLVLVTLDTRTDFSPDKEEFKTVIELILFHKEFSIKKMKEDCICATPGSKSSFQSFLETLIDKITKLNGDKYIKKENEQNFIILKNIDEEGKYTVNERKVKIKSVEKYRNPKNEAMIHLTCASPLAKLPYTKPKHKDFDNMDNECYNFLQLIMEMVEGIESNNLDPKQRMRIMNRTSFGAIFSTLRETQQTTIIEYLSGHLDNSQLDKKIGEFGGTMKGFISYLILLKYKLTTIEDDPTYNANKNEALGISKLGNYFNYNNWPIFEFRRCSSVKYNRIVQYFYMVLKELDKRDLSINFNAENANTLNYINITIP